MDKKLKFGVVGVGVRGCDCWVKMLSQRDDVEITALVDTNPRRMEDAAKLYNIKPNYYSTISELNAHEKVDAIILTTPDCFHEEHTIEALNAGINVLIDKPLATSVAGCRHVMEVSKKAGKVAMLGFNLRHHAVLQRMKELIAKGTIGQVFLMENREFYDGGRTYMARWNGKYSISGGLWIHKGSHDFDVFQWLLDFPKPIRVTSFAGINVLNPDHFPFQLKDGVKPGPTCTSCPYGEQCKDRFDISKGEYRLASWGEEATKIDGYHKDMCLYQSDLSTHDNGIAMVEYDNGARASHIECFVTSVTDRRYTIVGTLGQLEASLTDRTIILHPRWSEEVVTYKIPEADGGHGGADPMLLDQFIRVIRGEAANTSTLEHGMYSTAVGQAAEISRREGRIVEIAELFR